MTNQTANTLTTVHTTIIESVAYAAEVMLENNYVESYVKYNFEDIRVTTHLESNGFVYFTAIDPENEIFFTDDPEELYDALFTALVF